MNQLDSSFFTLPYYLLKILPFAHFKVQGNSMFPTYHAGESIFTFNWSYFWRKPKVGEIVVVFVGEKLIIKRIQKVSKDRVFLIGDNPGSSTDSRVFGEIPIGQVIGKVMG